MKVGLPKAAAAAASYFDRAHIRRDTQILLHCCDTSGTLVSE